jgi:hypothetical protein
MNRVIVWVLIGGIMIFTLPFLLSSSSADDPRFHRPGEIIGERLQLKSLTIRSPNGGEVWDRGRTYHISWISDRVDQVMIELFKGGDRVLTIGIPPRDARAGQRRVTRNYPWLIPTTLEPGPDYTLRIREIRGTTHDESDSAFSISDRPVLSQPPPRAHLNERVILPLRNGGFVIAPERPGQKVYHGNPWLGDDRDNYARQGFASFDLSGIPREATIVSAQLNLSEHLIFSGHPFEDLGNFQIIPTPYGTLDAFDYSRAGASGTVYNGGPPGPSLDVTSSVREWRAAGRELYQIRMQFDRETDGDRASDLLEFSLGTSLRIDYN